MAEKIQTIENIFYIGDTIPLAYMVRSRTKAIAKVLEVSVSVFSDEGEVVHEDPVQIIDNVVKYELSSDVTKHRGDYIAIFTHRFPNNEIKSHTIRFSIIPRGLPEEAEELPVSRLDDTSTENDVEKAISETLRLLRRRNRGEQLQFKRDLALAYDTAQWKLGKRIPK